MTLKETIWALFFAELLIQVVLYFLLPWIVKCHQSNQAFKKQLLADNEVLYNQGKTIESLIKPKE